jgi:hypothetical protein
LQRGEGVVRSERRRNAEIAVLEGVVIAHIDTVVLDPEGPLTDVRELVVRAERECGDGVVAPRAMRDPRLVVPVVDRVLGRDELDDEVGVPDA